MVRLFLSYARADDGEPYDPDRSFVHRLYRDLSKAGFEVWYDRVSMPSRNLTFHQEIRDAVSACDRLVLVVGPRAAASDYVRQEWQFAWFEAEKVVTPILRQGDYPLVPDELKLLHCEDFRDDAQYALHLANLVRQLTDPAPPLGKLIGVPSLPAHYLSRTDRLIPLRAAVRSGLDSPAPFGGVAARQQFHGIAGASKHVGMHGMGGIGKSVLANLLARDREIRCAFPDGIVWVGLGSVPNLAELMRRVHRELGGDGAFATEPEGKTKLKEVLSDKAVLLIIDDVWRRSDADAFDVLGPRCRALITTRDAGLLTSLAGTHHLVELLTDAEALNLLAVAADTTLADLPAEAHQVLRQCGRLPLAVALAGGMVAAGTPWTSLLTAFDRHKLEFFEDEHRPEQHQSLWKMIEISVQALPAAHQTRLVELAVFPEDEAVPAKAVATLWQHTGQLDELDTTQLLIKLKQRSLVQLTSGDAPDGAALGRVSLHDLIHDYCMRRAQLEFARPSVLHERLLSAYRSRSCVGWHTIPHDGYYLNHLRTHLVGAGRGGELADLLHELRWLEAKNAAGLTIDLLHDFSHAIAALSADDDRRRILKLLDEALRRDIQFITRHARDYPQVLFQCLWNLGWWYDCPEACLHYEPTDADLPDQSPWDRVQTKLFELMQRWQQQNQAERPGCWVRTFRPPASALAGGQVAVIRVDGSWVRGVAYSPDGRQIISGSEKGVRLWDAQTGAQLSVLGPEHRVNCVAYSPDGRRIASGSTDNTVRVWDAQTGSEIAVLRGHEGGILSVAYSSDGRRIISGSWDETVRVWDVQLRSELAVLRGHNSVVESVAYSPSNQQIISASRDNTVCVWNPQTASEITVLRGHERGVNCVAYSPDGLRIVSGSWDKTIRVWDIQTGSEVLVIREHGRSVESVAYSPDGRQIVSALDDKTVRVWNAQTGAQLTALHGQEHTVKSLAYSPDGLLVVGGSWETVRVWDAATTSKVAILRGHPHDIGSIVYSPDGRRIVSASADKTVRVWDAKSGAELAVLGGHEGGILSVAYSPDGRRISSGSWDGTVRVWDAQTGSKLAVLRGHKGSVNSLIYSPDGCRIISGSSDRTVRVWNAQTGSEVAVLRGHKLAVRSVACSPEGSRIVSGSEDETVRVWDTVSGLELAVLSGHEADITSVAFSPDGRRILSGSLDHTVRAWDAQTGSERVVVRGHQGSVNRVAYSPDGRRIVSRGEWDQTVRVWDADSGECLEIVNGSGDVTAISAGASAFPYRCLQREGETVIEGAVEHRAIAWFPDPLHDIVTHTSGRMWAGIKGNHLYLISLEGVDGKP